MRSAKDAKSHLECRVVSNGQAIRTYKGRSLGQAQCVLPPALPDGWQSQGEPGVTVDRQTDRQDTWEDTAGI